MTAVVTKLQVGAAALAVGAAAAFTPVAANAAPAVSTPAAPVHQVIGELPQAPGDFMYYSRVISLQIAASSIRFRTAVLDRRATRLEEYAAKYPNTWFGRQAAATAERLRERRAIYGGITFSACHNGSGIQVGPYGTVTRDAC
ncbi:hypothetical protein [Mycobacterium sp. SMC-4]|uniref:hypothetical protein n=1 Tax=Mycobacterium sp. SMC-4 TaxID=2857059 RepID=UPI003D0747A1